MTRKKERKEKGLSFYTSKNWKVNFQLSRQYIFSYLLFSPEEKNQPCLTPNFSAFS